MSNYTLMHKNDPVAIVNVNDSGIKIDNVIEQKLMPFGVIATSYKRMKYSASC